MTIIFDLDHTLFFADRFRAAFARVLRGYGVSAREFANTYALLRRETNGRATYSPERHLSLLAQKRMFDTRAAKRDCEIVMNRAARFLDPDAAPTLRGLRRRGHRLVLLTRGETRFQNRKISALGLRRYFDRVIVSPHEKHLTLARLPFRNGALIFVNDNSKELRKIRRILPHAILIERKRRRGLYTDNSWTTFSTLPAIGRAILRYETNP